MQQSRSLCEGLQESEGGGNVVNNIDMDKDTSEEERTPKQYDDSNSNLFLGTMQGAEKEEAKLWYTTIRLGDEDMNFSLNTGSKANLIPVLVFNKLPNQQLQPSKCKLVTYTG